MVLDEIDDRGGVPSHILREVSVLRDLDHPNIVNLVNLCMVEDGRSFHLIFEYAQEDLHSVLRSYRKAKEFVPMGRVQSYTKDILSGIMACHVLCIMHRDLKPQNVLVGSHGLKICDFGLARLFRLPVRHYTRDVITLWYRAPEVLLGAPRYGLEVDIWSAGCVIAEMCLGYPIFPGDSEIGTVFRIMRTLGTPTEETWPGASTFEFWSHNFPRWNQTGLQTFADHRPELAGGDGPPTEVAPDSAVALLRMLLVCCPTSRFSARMSKNHAFCRDAPQFEI